MVAEHAKGHAAALSVASNATLIALKVVAGIVTGSVAILTEAVHSSIDLLASIVAFISVRKADEPADAGHRYGHEKMENLAAAIEGALIIFGAAIIIYEAIARLIHPAHVHTIGVGIAVIATSAIVNVIVSRVIARRARALERRAVVCRKASETRQRPAPGGGGEVQLALRGLRAQRQRHDGHWQASLE